MKLLILILSFYLTLGYKELPKYSSTSFNDSENFYFKLDGFKSGDNIYFRLTSNNSQSLIQYKESNFLSEKEYIDSFLPAVYFITINNYFIIYDFTIKLNGNYKFLLLKFSGESSLFTIENKKNEYDSKIEIYNTKNETSPSKNQTGSSTDSNSKTKSIYLDNIIIIIIISFIIFLAIIIIPIILVICYLCKRKSSPDYANRIDSPLVPSYPAVQPQPQSTIYAQPGYQPYVVQPGYP